MDRENIVAELGRRDFIRSAAMVGAGAGVAGLLGACTDDDGSATGPSQTLVSGRKWVRLDASDASTGAFISLDGYSDNPEAVLNSGVVLSGYTVVSSGEILPLDTEVDGETASASTLHPLGGNQYQLVADGVPQPPGAPYEIHFIERSIPGTEVIVLTGFLYDPSTSKRITFTVTHDPIPLLIVVAVSASIVIAAISLAAVLTCLGSGGVKKLSYKVSKTTTGFTASGSVVCNHHQGSGG